MIVEPVIYESTEKFIESCTNLKDRINRIQLVIAALDNMMITAATTGNYDEYSLDDGQTKIRTKYRDINAIANSIDKFDLILQKLYARLNNNKNGRMIRLVDTKNFYPRCR
jgi:hypothetical protein